MLDKTIDLEEKEKMLRIATVKNYKFVRKNSPYKTKISKETVKNKIEELDFSNIPKRVCREVCVNEYIEKFV